MDNLHGMMDVDIVDYMLTAKNMDMANFTGQIIDVIKENGEMEIGQMEFILGPTELWKKYPSRINEKNKRKWRSLATVQKSIVFTYELLNLFLVLFCQF